MPTMYVRGIMYWAMYWAIVDMRNRYGIANYTCLYEDETAFMAAKSYLMLPKYLR